MKQRITYIRPAQSEFDLSNAIRVVDGVMNVTKIRAMKEHRFTSALEEQPPELFKILSKTTRFHLRWSSTRIDRKSNPFAARVPPGVNVAFTPKDDGFAHEFCTEVSSILVSPLKDSNCRRPIETISNGSSSNASTSHLWYSLEAGLPSLQHILEDNTPKPVSVDIDYDDASGAVETTIFWSNPNGNTGRGWTETFNPGEADDRVEIGILSEGSRTGVMLREEMNLKGWLTVLGQDKAPKGVDYDVSTRHHAMPSTSFFTMTFDEPTGLHPSMRLTLASISVTKKPAPSCTLHTYLTLPSFLFLDQYPLTDSLTLQSHNLVALRSLYGATDLEAPDWAIPEWGSSILLDLTDPSPNPGEPRHAVTIPLHLRYLSPGPGGYENVTVPYPVVFWACPVEGGTNLAASPFDRTNIGFDEHFGSRTIFYHFTPVPAETVGTLTEKLTVPVLDLNAGNAKYVEASTVITILLGFAYVIWCAFRPLPKRVKRAQATAGDHQLNKTAKNK